MFVVSRTEQFVIYYWTGANWATHKSKAKQFESRQAARSELDDLGIVYTVNINPA